MVAWVADWVGAELQPSVLQRHVSIDAVVVQASAFAPAATNTLDTEHAKTDVPDVVVLVHTSPAVPQSVVAVSDPVELSALVAT